jgi:EmrB/QacA subfamily drug resistance transporter
MHSSADDSQASAAPVETLSNPHEKWFVLAAVGISTFMSALDTSIVNAVLPVLTRSFNSSVATIEWVVVVYLLVVSGLLLGFGRLGDLHGHRPVFISGFFVFVLSSLMCGLAWSAGSLIFFRGVQALGAAMLAANSPAILTKSFPARQRGQALGLQATMTYLGLTVGPSLGGWLTDLYTWRSVFLINLPVGMAALAISWKFVPRDHIRKQVERFDLPGSITFIAGLVALLLGLNRGHEWGWTSLPILSLLGAAVVFLTAFVLIELRTPAPMLDLRLFRNKVFSTSVFNAVLNYIAVYTIMFIMPFYLVQGRNYSPTQAGMLLSSMPIIMALAAPVSGTLSDRIGVRLPTTFGMFLLAAGLFLLSGLGADATPMQVVLAMGAAGLGVGTFISPNNSALMGSAPRERQGIAAGAMATARNVGMVLGVGLSGAILTTYLHHGPVNVALLEGVQAAFLVSAGIALVGGVSSALFGGSARSRSAPITVQKG